MTALLGRENRRTALLALALAALVYLPRLGAPLMWDDRPYLINVGDFDRPVPLRRYVSPDYFSFTGELTWRPMATFSYATLVRSFGRNPLLLRLAMFAAHALNCVLIALLIATTGLGAETAVTAACLFLIQPVHIETLMTVTFNKEILSTLGILLMLLAHRKRRPGIAAAGLAFAALTKESGMMGLVLTLMSDYFQGGVEELRRRWKDHMSYAVVGLIYLVIRFGPMKGPGGEANLSAALPWTERLYYAAHGFASSVMAIFAPVNLRIDYFALPARSPFEYAFWIAAAAATVVLTLALAVRHRRKEPLLSFFLLWPLPVLFLTSNIFPTAVLSLRLMAERWLYLPAVGVMTALAWFLRGHPRRLRLLLVFWGLLGLIRIQDWTDEPRLWHSLARVYPWSAKAVEGEGEALFHAGRTVEAKAAFEKGLALRDNREDLVLAHYVPLAPPGTIAWDNAPLQRWLGLCALRLGDERKAADYFRKSADLQPSDVFTDRVLAYLAARAGDFKAARSWIDRGLAGDPSDGFLLRLKPDVEKKRLGFQARFD
ncbi:MAG: tetratricopeptide repeat protein [Elusimicrobiota bacterium]